MFTLNNTAVRLALFCWAIRFTSIPAQVAPATELNRVNRTTNSFPIIKLDGQFHKPHCTFNVNVFWSDIGTGPPGFGFLCSAWRSLLNEFDCDCPVSEGTKVTWAILYVTNLSAYRVIHVAGLESYKYVNQLKSPGRIASSKECSREAAVGGPLLNLGSIMIGGFRPFEPKRFRKTVRNVQQVASRSRVSRNDFFVRNVGFVKVIPRRDRRPQGANETSGSSSDEHYITARCGNLTLIIKLKATKSDSAITNHNNFLVREVGYPKGPLLDLGKCRQDEKDKDRQPFHLILLDSDTSAMTERDKKTLLDGFSVILSWDNKHWYSVIRNAFSVVAPKGWKRK